MIVARVVSVPESFILLGAQAQSFGYSVVHRVKWAIYVAGTRIPTFIIGCGSKEHRKPMRCNASGAGDRKYVDEAFCAVESVLLSLFSLRLRLVADDSRHDSTSPPSELFSIEEDGG